MRSEAIIGVIVTKVKSNLQNYSEKQHCWQH